MTANERIAQSHEPISVGDLVVVVRGPMCCKNPSKNGLIFRVDEFTHEDSGLHCRYCGAKREGGEVAMPANSERGFYLNRLKRIPPLSELEGEKRDEEIAA